MTKNKKEMEMSNVEEYWEIATSREMTHEEINEISEGNLWSLDMWLNAFIGHYGNRKPNALIAANHLKIQTVRLRKLIECNQ